MRDYVPLAWLPAGEAEIESGILLDDPAVVDLRSEFFDPAIHASLQPLLFRTTIPFLASSPSPITQATGDIRTLSPLMM